MGKGAKVALGLAFAALVLLGLRIGITAMRPPNDQVLIELALAESIQASKEGRPGGVMDKLSSQLRFNEVDASGNRRQIADYIKNNKPDVTVLNKTAVVTGDEARIVSPVEVSINFLGERKFQLNEVTMVFRREPDRAYLIIPTSKWKLAEVRVPDASLADFMP
jgi:hypothetical protein